MSTALNGTLLARKIVSSREVAVTICDEPAVREVKMYRAGSVEYVVMLAMTSLQWRLCEIVVSLNCG